MGLLRPAGLASGAAAPSSSYGSLLDVRDAAVLNLLGETAAALKLIYAKCGEEFPTHLVGWWGHAPLPVGLGGVGVGNRSMGRW